MANTSPYQPDLLSIASNYRQRCFNCPYDNCGASVRQPSTLLTQHPSISNFIVVTCHDCHRKWYFCMLCEGQQLPLRSESSAMKHILNQHRVPKSKRKQAPVAFYTTADSVNFNLQNPPSVSDASNSFTVPVKPTCITRKKARVAIDPKSIPPTNNMLSPPSPNDFAIHFEEDENKKSLTATTAVDNTNTIVKSLKKSSNITDYNQFATSSTNSSSQSYCRYNTANLSYFANVKKDHTNASAHVVAKENRLPSGSIVQLKCEETKQQMLLAKISRSLTKSQLNDFASYLQSLSKTHLLGNNNTIALFKNVPVRVSEFRRLYMDGTNSVSQNVPKPKSVMLKHHSYVSVNDCIDDFLARNTIAISNFDEVKYYNNDMSHQYDNIYNSKAASQVTTHINHRLQDHPLLMRFPVTCCLMYIWSDDFDKNKDILQQAYPVAVGRKGLDHSEVISLFFKESTSLRSGVFKSMYSTGNQVCAC
jgi:hypothetical protein